MKADEDIVTLNAGSVPTHWVEFAYPDGRRFCKDGPPNWWNRLWLRIFFGFH